MTIWLDAQLSPALAPWLSQQFGLTAIPIRDLHLRDTTDAAIFEAARQANVIVLTKDADFPRLLDRHGPPPRIVWLTCGNTSNSALTEILTRAWPIAAKMLTDGEALVEITGRPLADDTHI